MTTTAPTGLQLDGLHWAFALDFYQRPGVADACLRLQDYVGVDVTLLLFALYMADSHGTVLEQADLEDLDHTVGAWREDVVRPLRQLRRRLKNGPDPAPGAATEGLRDRIKAAELHAEQIELAALARWLEGRRIEPKSKPADITAALEGVMALCAGRASPQQAGPPEVQAALDAIRAAFTDRA
jgi:uncharacterized protein (TIGR02444 family)